MTPPTREQLPAIAALLGANGLPTSDLAQLDLSLFLVEGTANAIEAVGGLERFADYALLRSVAVAAPHRGRGLARRVVGELERLAERRHIDELFLLTETAEGFFAAHDYSVRDRATVPAAIRASCQFAALCPASATVMSKRLSANDR